MLRVAAILGIAAVGGGVALLGAAVTGHLDERTTVSQVVSAPAVPAALITHRRLSVEQIYRSDAPGVVQITAIIAIRPAAITTSSGVRPGRGW